MKKIPKEKIEEIWNKLTSRRICKKCGGFLKFDGRDVLMCIICGNRYYKDFPKRPHDSEICMSCGSFFVPTDNSKVSNLCDDCLSEKYNLVQLKRKRPVLKLISVAKNSQ
jgi:hypothetical protein